ncbi:MAG: hypothetical protein QW590_00625 [Candidatus Bilamarchaeaceae archaeon]
MARLEERGKPAIEKEKIEEAKAVLNKLVEHYAQQGIEFSLTKKEIESIAEQVAGKSNISGAVRWQLLKTLARKDAGLATELYGRMYSRTYGGITKSQLDEAIELANRRGGLEGFLDAKRYIRSLPKTKEELLTTSEDLQKTKTVLDMLKKLREMNRELLNVANKLYHHDYKIEEEKEARNKMKKLEKERNDLLEKLGLSLERYLTKEYTWLYGKGWCIIDSPLADELKEGTCSNPYSVAGNAKYVDVRVNAMIEKLEKKMAELKGQQLVV